MILDPNAEVTSADGIGEVSSWNLSLEEILELAYQKYLKNNSNSSEISVDFREIKLGVETAYYHLISCQEKSLSIFKSF